MGNNVYAWHFLTANMRSGKGDQLDPWVDGPVERFDGELQPCVSGLHSSPTPWGALQYAPGPLLSLVEISDVGPDCIPHGMPVNKHCSRWRRRVLTLDVSKELRLFACDMAEEALTRVEARWQSVDGRSRAAVATARQFARGEASTEELAAARAAARDAYLDTNVSVVVEDSAARAAWETTWETTWDAAMEVVRDIVRSAAWNGTSDAAIMAAAEAEFNVLVEPLFAEERAEMTRGQATNKQ